MIPERYVGFKCYFDAVELEGVVDVEIPKLEAMVETVKGAGILGEVETPSLGNFSAMNMTINWRTAARPQALLMHTLASHLIELKGSIQYKDSASGLISTKQMRVITRSRVKSSSYGKVEVAASGDASTEFSVEYLNVFYDNIPQVEYDPLNFVFRVNGVDQLASVRADIS